MSFYNDASLVFLPSGGAGKDIKAYSIKPTDGSGDFTFSRGSNLTATRVDSNGLIEKGRENLLKDSNSFNPSGTVWNSTTAYTFTSGEEGYDGSSDAWLLNKTTTGNDYFQQRSINGMSGNIITESIYAKAGTEVGLMLYNANGFVRWDLSDGSVILISGANLISHSIEQVGATDWYRCSITIRGGISYDRMMIKIVDSNGNDTDGSIYIQDAQIELGLVATEYIESGATTGKAGILEDSPRFDYSGEASCPSLLLEPSRTNSYIYHSEYITSSLANISREISNVDSPIKDTPFLKITKTGTGISRLSFTSFSTNGDFDTCSVFAKAGSSNIILFADSYNGLSTINAKFNLTNGDWDETPSGSALYDYGFEDFGNGMYRVWVCGQTYNADTPEITARWRTPALYFDIDQLPLGEYIYITGMQTEKNAKYPTSYIPNHSGGSVTREADSSTSGTISNVTEGVLFFEGSVLKNNNTVKLVEFNDGGLLNVIQLYYRDSSGTQPRVYAIAKSGGTQVYGYAYNIPSGSGEDTHKVAFRFEDNNFAMFYNGTKVHSQTSGTTSTNPKNQLMYETSAGAIPFRGNVKQTLVFGTALADDDCITLTTL